LATRVVEIKRDEVKDYLGTYGEYVHYCGDDHLDADSVVLKARTEKQDRKQTPKSDGVAARPAKVDPAVLLNRLTRARDALTERIETAEGRVAEIDALFCRPGYFEEAPADEVAQLQAERAALQRSVEGLTEEWAAVETKIEAL
jgi:hypothetical protein